VLGVFGYGVDEVVLLPSSRYWFFHTTLGFTCHWPNTMGFVYLLDVRGAV